MKKDTLTMQHIRSDLRHQLRGTVILAVACAVVTAFGLWGLFRIIFVEGVLYGTFRIALMCFAFLAIAIVCGVHIMNIYSALSDLGRIVTDRVVGMETKDHLRRGLLLPRCDQTYHLRFAGYGEYVLPQHNFSWSALHAMDADMVYFHAECDDEFYLVLSKPHTGTILLAYPKKLFTLEQTEKEGNPV